MPLVFPSICNTTSSPFAGVIEGIALPTAAIPGKPFAHQLWWGCCCDSAASRWLPCIAQWTWTWACRGHGHCKRHIRTCHSGCPYSSRERWVLQGGETPPQKYLKQMAQKYWFQPSNWERFRRRAFLQLSQVKRGALCLLPPRPGEGVGKSLRCQCVHPIIASTASKEATCTQNCPCKSGIAQATSGWGPSKQ